MLFDVNDTLYALYKHNYKDEKVNLFNFVIFLKLDLFFDVLFPYYMFLYPCHISVCFSLHSSLQGMP